MFNHLREVNMTYWKHFHFSASLSIDLFVGSIKALIHAVYPDIYTESTTNLLDELSNKMKKMK